MLELTASAPPGYNEEKQTVQGGGDIPSLPKG